VFEAAYKIDVGELRRSFLMIAFLAAPGVIITAAVVAVVVSR
jgi:NhaP-type Na+/H+ or K+/H+ antiporter